MRVIPDSSKWQIKYYTITAGQAVSLLGSSAAQFALIWWLAKTTGSAIVMSVAGLVSFLPLIFLGPIAGVWVDRLKLKSVLIVADLFIALFALLFAVAAWLGEPQQWMAFAVLFLRAVGGAFHAPAMQKTVPMLVPEEKLLRANSVAQFIQTGAFMLGPVIGAALYAALPLSAIMLADVVGAVIASGAVALINIPNPERSDEEQTPHIWREMKEGAKVLLSMRKLLFVTIVSTLCMVAYLPLSTLYPLMTSDHLLGTEWHAGIVEFVYAAGMMAASAIIGARGDVKNKYALMHMGLLLLGATSLFCGLLPPGMRYFWAFAALCALMGAGGQVYSIPYMAHMQAVIPPEKMGRVFSLIGSLMSIAMPLGLLIAGPVAQRMGVAHWFLIAGIVTVIITAASMLISRRMKE